MNVPTQVCDRRPHKGTHFDLQRLQAREFFSRVEAITEKQHNWKVLQT